MNERRDSALSQLRPESLYQPKHPRLWAFSVRAKDAHVRVVIQNEAGHTIAFAVQASEGRRLAIGEEPVAYRKGPMNALRENLINRTSARPDAKCNRRCIVPQAGPQDIAVMQDVRFNPGACANVSPDLIAVNPRMAFSQSRRRSIGHRDFQRRSGHAHVSYRVRRVKVRGDNLCRNRIESPVQTLTATWIAAQIDCYDCLRTRLASLRCTAGFFFPFEDVLPHWPSNLERAFA